MTAVYLENEVMKPADIPAILSVTFIQITLPIIITVSVASWRRGKRFKGMNRRLDQVLKRLDRVHAKLSKFSERIVCLEQRISQLAR